MELVRRFPNTVLITLALGVGSFLAMILICWRFSAPVTAPFFHLALLLPFLYLLLSMARVAALIPVRWLSKWVTFTAWSVLTLLLVVIYVMYYIAMANWGLPMDYVMMVQHLKELPYIINALPIGGSLIYGIIAFPLVLISGFFAVKSAVLAREMEEINRTIFTGVSRQLLWLLPAVMITGFYASPYFQEQINGPYRTIYDPVLSFFHFRFVQNQHLVEDVGADHLAAKQEYPENLLSHRPNVILIICDALRADHLSNYGYFRPTSPFLDELVAAENTLAHHRFFSNTSASYTGITGILGSKDRITLHSFMLQEVLKKQGYHTRFYLSGNFLKFYGLSEALNSSVDEYYDGNIHVNHDATDKFSMADDSQIVIEKLRNLPSWNGTPEFFYLHYMSTHQIGKADEQFNAYLPRNYSLVNRDPSTFVNDYDNRIMQLDSYLQQSLEVLAEKGYLKDAVVLITADHGQSLLENEHLFHSSSTEMSETYIPLIITSYGGSTLPGQAILTINDQMDIAPTLLDLLDLPKPTSWQGTSIFKDTISGPVFQREAGFYSVISTVNDRLIQLTYHKNERIFQLTDVTQPSAPVSLEVDDTYPVDSLKELLFDYFTLGSQG